MNALVNSLNDLPVWAFASLLGLLGLLLGSFLNVVIVRLPVMMEREERLFIAQATDRTPDHELLGRYNLLTPASHCPQCREPVRWWMNVPVLSYLALRGRCHGCKLGISVQYPLVEIACAAAGLLAALYFGAGLKSIAVAGLLWALITLTVIDLNTQLLPDVITLPLLWAGLLFNLAGGLAPLSSAVWGAVAGYLSLWSVYQLFKLLTGKEGMGYGDFKLLAALGAWLGVGMILPIILFASFTGALVGVSLIVLKRRDMSDKIPFGPYLAAGGAAALFYGQRVVDWYLGTLA